MRKPQSAGAPELDALHQAILSWYGESGHLDPAGLSNHLSGIGFAGLVKQLAASGPGTRWYDRDGVTESAVLDGWRRCVARHRQFAERRARMPSRPRWRSSVPTPGRMSWR